MTKDPALPFYARDWYTGTSDLPLDVQGAYVRLLCRQWLDGKLPAAEARLAGIVGVPVARFRKMWAFLEEHFPIVDGAPQNQRLERERAERAEYREKKSQAGSEGARKRWHKDGKDDGKPTAKAWPASASASASQNDSSVVSSGSVPAAPTHKPFAHANEQPGRDRHREPGQGMQPVAAILRVRRPG